MTRGPCAHQVKDVFLLKQLAADSTGEGWVLLEVIASFAKIKSMTTLRRVLQESIRNKSKQLVLDEAGERVKRAVALDPALLEKREPVKQLSAEEMVVRLEGLCDSVASLRLSPEQAKGEGLASSFRQVGSLKVFLRRLAQLGTTGCFRKAAEAGGKKKQQQQRLQSLAARALHMIECGAGWLSEVNELSQLEEVRPTANHLGQNLVMARRELTGVVVPEPVRKVYRTALSQVDKQVHALKEEQKRLTTSIMTTAKAGYLRRSSTPLESETDTDTGSGTGEQAPAATADSPSAVLAVVSPAMASSLSVEIEALVTAHLPTAGELATKEALRAWLEGLLASRFPGATLQVYGSSGSGLGLRGADLDLCLLMPPGDVREACRGLIDAEAAGLFGLRPPTEEEAPEVAVEAVAPAESPEVNPPETDSEVGSAKADATEGEGGALESTVEPEPEGEHEEDSEARGSTETKAAVASEDQAEETKGETEEQTETEPETEPAQKEKEEEQEEEEMFEDEYRERRKVAAAAVVSMMGHVLRPRCRVYIADASKITPTPTPPPTTPDTTEPEATPAEGAEEGTGAATAAEQAAEGGGEGEAVGLRRGEWLDATLIVQARVPILTLAVGGFPFLSDEHLQEQQLQQQQQQQQQQEEEEKQEQVERVDEGGGQEEEAAAAVASAQEAIDPADAAEPSPEPPPSSEPPVEPEPSPESTSVGVPVGGGEGGSVAAPPTMECDICVEHELVLRNTSLLQAYAQLDPRVVPLIITIKIWAKKAGVAEAFKGTLSSYAWVLLAIFYLQQTTPPVLPVLQAPELLVKWKYGKVVADWQRPPTPETEFCDTSFCADTDQARDALKAAAAAATAGSGGVAPASALSVAELLLGFFEFYGWGVSSTTGGGGALLAESADGGSAAAVTRSAQLDLTKHVISVRLGKAFPKTDYAPAAASRRSEWRFTVEDPFERQHDLGTVVHSREGQQALTRGLRRAAAALQASPLSTTAAAATPGAAADEVSAEEQPQSAAAAVLARFLDVQPCIVDKVCYNCGLTGHFSRDCPEEEWEEDDQGASSGSLCFWYKMTHNTIPQVDSSAHQIPFIYISLSTPHINTQYVINYASSPRRFMRTWILAHNPIVFSISKITKIITILV